MNPEYQGSFEPKEGAPTQHKSIPKTFGEQSPKEEADELRRLIYENTLLVSWMDKNYGKVPRDEFLNKARELVGIETYSQALMKKRDHKVLRESQTTPPHDEALSRLPDLYEGPMSQHTAVVVLQRLAEIGAAGGDSRIHPYVIGRALRRTLSINGDLPDAYNLAEIQRAFKGESSEMYGAIADEDKNFD
jgi:hypothetical protein